MMPIDKQREYAWNYFQVHAQQRLQTFEFYITISTVLLGGYVASWEFEQMRRISWGIGVGILFMSFVFWKLDARTSELIKNAENALKRIERDVGEGVNSNGVPADFNLFERDDYLTSKKNKFPLASGHFTYSRCFRWVFLAFALAGTFVVFMGLLDRGGQEKSAEEECLVRINSMHVTKLIEPQAKHGAEMTRQREDKAMACLSEPLSAKADSVAAPAGDTRSSQ